MTARQRTRDIAELVGFDRLEQTRVATAVLRARPQRAPLRGRGRGADPLRGRPAADRRDRRGARASRTSTRCSRRVRLRHRHGPRADRRAADDGRVRRSPRRAGRGTRVTVAKRLPAGTPLPDAARRCATSCPSAARARPFDEVSRQNEELLQALGEVRRRQQEMLALNRELEETNQGVVALYAELDDRAERLRRGRRAQVALPGRHEPRAAHAAELDHRAERAAAQRRAGAGRRAGRRRWRSSGAWPRTSCG